MILPELPHLDRGIHEARAPYHGYQRSMTLAERLHLVSGDSIFKKAEDLVGNRILTSPHRRANIYLIIRYFLQDIPRGDIIEFGTFRGAWQ